MNFRPEPCPHCGDWRLAFGHGSAFWVDRLGTISGLQIDSRDSGVRWTAQRLARAGLVWARLELQRPVFGTGGSGIRRQLVERAAARANAAAEAEGMAGNTGKDRGQV